MEVITTTAFFGELPLARYLCSTCPTRSRILFTTRLVTRHPEWKKEDLELYCLGNKGRETFARQGYQVKECDSDIVESPVYAVALSMACMRAPFSLATDSLRAP